MNVPPALARPAARVRTHLGAYRVFYAAVLATFAGLLAVAVWQRDRLPAGPGWDPLTFWTAAYTVLTGAIAVGAFLAWQSSQRQIRMSTYTQVELVRLVRTRAGLHVELRSTGPGVASAVQVRIWPILIRVPNTDPEFGRGFIEMLELFRRLQAGERPNNPLPLTVSSSGVAAGAFWRTPSAPFPLQYPAPILPDGNTVVACLEVRVWGSDGSEILSPRIFQSFADVE